MAEQNNQAERAAFEAWHRSKFATRHSTGQPTRDMHNGIYDENYGPEHQQQMWEAWQAARRAALPAAVDAEGLTALVLPEPTAYVASEYVGCGIRCGVASWVKSAPPDGTQLFTAEQAGQAQRDAIAADRRKQAALTQMIELGQEIEASGEPEYELHQDEMLVAGTSGKSAYDEILHYAAQYVQDGPVEIYKVVRTKLAIPAAAPFHQSQETK